MAYTINKTNGDLFATVQDGTINTDSSLVLLGKNYAGYGESLNENFFRLLESHANATPPTTPQPGQLWFDTSAGLLKLWNADEWKDLGSSTAGITGPTDPVVGDMWYDTVNSQLNVYDGATYVLVGPSFSSGTGTTGYLVETVTDGVLDYVIIKVVVSDAIVAIISKDVTFTPIPAIAGFTTIYPGYNLASAVDGGEPKYIGTAANADLLGDVAPSGYLSALNNDTTTGTLGISNDGGLQVGVGALLTDGLAEISVDGADVIIANIGDDGDLIFQVDKAGTPTTVITLDGPSARARVDTPLAGTDIANVDSVNSAIAAGTSASSQALESATTTVDVSAATAPAAGEVLTATGPTTAIWKTIIDLVYPVGAIYASAAATDPTAMFGGTWVSIQGRTLFAEDGTGGYTAGNTGGSKDAVNVSHSHTASTSNDTHSHNLTKTMSNSLGGSLNTYITGTGFVGTQATTGTQNDTHNHSVTVNASGVSGTDANMPPYLAVYMWQRTA